MAKTLTALLVAGFWWIVKHLGGHPPNPKAVDIRGKKLCVPLFYIDADGDITSTWNFLVKSKAHREAFYKFAKSIRAKGEVVGCAFLLTPPGASGMWLAFPVSLNKDGVAAARLVLREMSENGVAALATLYTDDDEPRFWHIKEHLAGWAQLDFRVGELLSACLLSIESNEYAGSIGELQDYIEQIRRAMPTVGVYGTHLQWATRTPYSWNNAHSTPANADLILGEAPWHISKDRPDEGEDQGAGGIERWVKAMRDGGVDLNKVVLHEFNIKPGTKTSDAQREAGRRLGVRGVGG